MHDLRDELEDIRGKLPQKGNFLDISPDIWESGIYSGQIRLLSSEQVNKLAKIYKLVKLVDYISKRAVRTTYQISLEEEITTLIDTILQEKWWE